MYGLGSKLPVPSMSGLDFAVANKEFTSLKWLMRLGFSYHLTDNTPV